MTNAELIKALRYCGQEQDVIDCADCERRMIENGVDVDCEGRLLRDAADALEAVDKRIDGLQKLVDINTERCEALRKQLRDSHESYEKHINELTTKCNQLQAEVDNYEKRIAELEAQLPKEGEWIIDGMNEYQLSYGCVGYEPIYRCSKCGITTESYLRTERPIMPEDADFPNYCPYCGARMKTVTECHTLEEGER